MVHSLTNGLHGFCVWVMRLAYLNLLWLLFTLAGLGVAGLMPATAAMFTVTREWVKGNPDASVFSVFLRAYKKEWGRSNAIGLILGLTGVFLYTDVQIAAGMNQPLLVYVFMSIGLIYALILLYVFPVYVHYDVKIKEVLSFSFLIAFTRPAVTLGMAISAVGVLFLVFFHMTFLLFFSGSVLSFILTKLAFKAFLAVDRHAKEKAA